MRTKDTCDGPNCEKARESEQTPGEFVRELVLNAFGDEQPEATAAEQALLSEILALRTILINTVYDLASGDATPERMKALIEKADAEKLHKAIERLKSIPRPTR